MPTSGGPAPDELLIDWTTLPAGSDATLYLPGADATAIKKAADQRYVVHHLKLIDPHTLATPARGITYVPIPEGSGANLPGLLTIALPSSVRYGQAFRVVVREVSNIAGKATVPPPPIGLGAAAAASARRDQALRWRRITGSFQISIPVRTEDVLLLPEERLLAVLRWILESIPTANRWRPVFGRYVDQIADRVRGLGGNPDEIKPSPTGDVRPGRELARCFTGKVCEVAFDCFGDFDGFVLDACEARRSFRSRETGVGKLVLQAVRDRLTITVCLDERKESRIERIIVRC